MQDTVIEVLADDGTTVPVYWYPVKNARSALLFLPALGIQARLYRKLAQQLSAGGHAVALVEQRGHGLSPLRPAYHCRFDLDDTLERDIPAVLDWLRTQVPERPLLVGGHSLGGHLSTIYAGRHADEIAGLLHMACAFPYYADYPPKERALLRFLCAVMPVFQLLPGYYPGNIMGFGDRESIAMMMQWRQWALSGKFDYGTHRDAAVAGAFKGPVLSIGFEQDNFSSEAAVERALSPLGNAKVTRVRLGSAEQGEHLGHVNWARSPEGASQCVATWLDQVTTP